MVDPATSAHILNYSILKSALLPMRTSTHAKENRLYLSGKSNTICSYRQNSISGLGVLPLRASIAGLEHFPNLTKTFFESHWDTERSVLIPSASDVKIEYATKESSDLHWRTFSASQWYNQYHVLILSATEMKIRHVTIESLDLYWQIFSASRWYF